MKTVAVAGANTAGRELFRLPLETGMEPVLGTGLFPLSPSGDND